MDLTDDIIGMSIDSNIRKANTINATTNASNSTASASSSTSATAPTITNSFSSISSIGAQNNGQPQNTSRYGVEFTAAAAADDESPITNWQNSIGENMKPFDTLDTHKQQLKQLVDQISLQRAKLSQLKTFLRQVKEQAAINVELNNELKQVNSSIDEKQGELKKALNQIDNLNRQLTSHKRKKSHFGGRSQRAGLQNKSGTSNGRRVSFDPLALFLDAALEGELDLVIQTSKQVPDLSASHDECITALHNAALTGHYNVAKYLIEAGCDINVQDSDGWTPLHCAASCNHLPLIKLHVENGALIYATTSTSDKSTPAAKCSRGTSGFDECYNYLIYIQNNLGVMNNAVVYALYDYDAQEEDELSFTTDEELIILRRDDSEEQEWWWAQKKIQQPSDSMIDIKEGYIPRNLVGLHPRHPAYKRAKQKALALAKNVRNGSSVED